jgi:hypothetical protein
MFYLKVTDFRFVFHRHCGTFCKNHLYYSEYMLTFQMNGIEYLYKQTSQILEDYIQTLEAIETKAEEDPV